ncbi:hypothetical protein EV421DRAFT_462675 [Armillaria borealis]|uniref:Uncharacterized protein n=1 Tax=Armillaria borealis TaxID=47425 RepID=A0AA39K5I1_9AGAR|nr:hypothetical protein EV421DRAFT_462675 [Armillaria borealis]
MKDAVPASLISVSAALGATLVSAQLGLSTGCVAALSAVSADPEASICLSLSTLIPLFGNGNTSIVDPVNTWVSNVCSVGPCSNDTVAAVVGNLTSGCSTELATIGLNTSETDQNIVTAQEAYPTVRRILCLQDSDTYCVTETLRGIESSVGTLSVNRIVSFLGGQASFSSLPSNVTCSNCTKAAYNILQEAYPALVNNGTESIQSQCGEAFTDGSSPSGITETAQGASNQNSGAPTNAMQIGFTISTSFVILMAVTLA